MTGKYKNEPSFLPEMEASELFAKLASESFWSVESVNGQPKQHTKIALFGADVQPAKGNTQPPALPFPLYLEDLKQRLEEHLNTTFDSLQIHHHLNGEAVVRPHRDGPCSDAVAMLSLGATRPFVLSEFGTLYLVSGSLLTLYADDKGFVTRHEMPAETGCGEKMSLIFRNKYRPVTSDRMEPSKSADTNKRGEDYNAWLKRGEPLIASWKNAKWAVGDWLLDAEYDVILEVVAKEQRVDYKNWIREAARRFDVEYDYLLEFRRVAEAFPTPPTRVGGLSWGHHRMAAGVENFDERQKWLLRAADGHWTTDALRKAIAANNPDLPKKTPSPFDYNERELKALASLRKQMHLEQYELVPTIVKHFLSHGDVDSFIDSYKQPARKEPYQSAKMSTYRLRTAVR